MKVIAVEFLLLLFCHTTSALSKPKRTLFLFFLFAVLQAAPQTFGLKTGLALCNYSATYKDYSTPGNTQLFLGTSAKPGFIFGGYIDIQLRKSLFLRPGAEMVIKGAVEKVSYTDNASTRYYNYGYNFVAIDLPLNLVYKNKPDGQQRLIVGGGIVPGILLESDLSRGDLGLNALIGYEFPIGLNFNINYNYGLLNVGSNSYRFRSLRNRYLGITVGYFF